MNRPRWQSRGGERWAFDFDFPVVPLEEREEIDSWLRALRPDPLPESALRHILHRVGISPAPRSGRPALRESLCLCLSAACLAIALLWPCLAVLGHEHDRRPLSCPGGTFSR
jgi:hypothetical protein